MARLALTERLNARVERRGRTGHLVLVAHVFFPEAREPRQELRIAARCHGDGLYGFAEREAVSLSGAQNILTRAYIATGDGAPELLGRARTNELVRLHQRVQRRPPVTRLAAQPYSYLPTPAATVGHELLGDPRNVPKRHRVRRIRRPEARGVKLAERSTRFAHLHPVASVLGREGSLAGSTATASNGAQVATDRRVHPKSISRS